jgi:hypothetical protein
VSDNGLYNDVSNLYSRGGRWASALAALSPDEDFVETYELSVLRHATNTPLQNLALNVFHNNRQFQVGDVPSDDIAGYKEELADKEACFAALYSSSRR